MDKENFFSSHERREFHKIAIAVPKLIASCIGQSNMKIRFKQLNKMKDCLLELKHLSNSSHLIENKGYGYLLNEIENYRLQVWWYVNTKLDNFLKVCPFIFGRTLIV